MAAKMVAPAAVPDEVLSKYSLMYKHQSEELRDVNVEKLQKPIEDYRLRLDLRIMRKYLKGPRVLDFPIGTGRMYPQLMNEYEIYGFDICANYIERASSFYPAIADHFQVQAFETLDATNKFDSVYTLRTLNGIKDIPAAVESVSRIVNPGGRWLFNLPIENEVDADMPDILKRNGFKLVKRLKYDAYVNYGLFHPVLNRIYGSLWMRGVNRHLIPDWLFRLVDRALAGSAVHFYVAER